MDIDNLHNYGMLIFTILNFIIALPVGNFLNYQTIKTFNTHMKTAVSVKYFFSNFVITNTLTMNINVVYYFLLTYGTSNQLCFWLDYLARCLRFWSQIHIFLYILNIYLHMNSIFIKFFDRKLSYLCIDVITLFIPVVINLPWIKLALENKRKNNSDIYLTCNYFKRDYLISISLFELIFNIIIPTVAILVLTTSISCKLIKSKKRLRRSLSRRSKNSFKKEYKYSTLTFLLTISGIAFKLPLWILVFVKNLNLKINFKFFNENKNLFIFLENVSYFLYVVYYLLPFLVNYLMNPVFRHNFLKNNKRVPQPGPTPL